MNKLFLIALVAIVYCGPALADYQPKIPGYLTALYDVDDVDAARKILVQITKQAKAGERDAQMALGRLLCLGDFMERDCEQGKVLLKTASDKGDAFAAWTMALTTYDVMKPQEGFHWLVKAARLGDIRAGLLLYYCHATRNYCRIKLEKTLPVLDAELSGYLDRAAKAEHPDALRLKGFFDYSKAKTDDERAIALELFKRGMEIMGAPVPARLDPLASWYDFEKRTKNLHEDEYLKESTKLFKNMADDGWAYAIWQYSTTLTENRIRFRSQWERDKTVRKYMRQAADAGYIPAMAEIVWIAWKPLDTKLWLTENGYGVKAAKKGSVSVIESIGRRLLEWDEKPDQAAPWLFLAERYDRRRANEELNPWWKKMSSSRLSASVKANYLAKKLGGVPFTASPMALDTTCSFFTCR